MKLAWVVFEREVQTELGVRVPGLFEDEGWDIERHDDGIIHATRNGRTIHLDGYAYTYETAASASAVEGVGTSPPPSSAAESGAAVDQGLTGAAGSTPARLAKGKRR